MRACSAARAPIVPQGGNTGLVGGGVPRAQGQVLMSLTRLDHVGEVDEEAGMLRVGAGATLSEVHAAAGSRGWRFAVDLAARDSATTGGMIATNAGGVHVIRHGPMRSNVTGLEVVLAGGAKVARLSGFEKDATGYDLVQLLAGSEGTLGVLTAAVLKLVPEVSHRVTALVGLACSDATGSPGRDAGRAACPGGSSRTATGAAEPATRAALAVLAHLRQSVDALEAAELMFADGISLVAEHARLPLPLLHEAPAYLLVECAAHHDPTDELAAALGSCPQVADTAVADDAGGRRALWAYRDRHTQAVASLGVPHKLDVSLPLGALASFVAAVRELVASVDPSYTTVIWGHLGEGNLHVNVIGPAPDDLEVDDAVLQLVAAAGGSISAEHGVGIAKTKWLGLTRSPGDIEAMRSIKGALDPEGLLNPGVLLPG